MSDVRLRFAMMRQGGRRNPWTLHDAMTNRMHDLARYTPAERRQLCKWLNERDARYPVPRRLAAYHKKR